MSVSVRFMLRGEATWWKRILGWRDFRYEFGSGVWRRKLFVVGGVWVQEVWKPGRSEPITFVSEPEVGVRWRGAGVVESGRKHGNMHESGSGGTVEGPAKTCAASVRSRTTLTSQQNTFP